MKRCIDCEHYAYGYGRISYRICKKAVKLLKKQPKTRPNWCPLKQEKSEVHQ